MVQRKVSNKLGVLPDHVKSERGMRNLKPTSQHQDCKNKAADLKIKMKKSRSMKPSDINSPRSSASKRISLPGKPPPGINQTISTPQKQSSNTAVEWSPNYMKSTSSADARKGSSMASSRNSKSLSDSKLIHKRNSSGSKVSSASGNKLATRSSSMKLVRSLTQAPSFKNARSTAKKCSRIAICADMNVQRATCSSTMKDSKFPHFLVLNPGGTEVEGTSIEKVCPYTYCSLNGHHHSPVPPLKLFLSTMRRSLKTQQGFKVEALSPHRAKKPVVEESKKVENTPLYKDKEFNCTTFPLMQEEEMDSFIEIYDNNNKDDGGANKDCEDANDEGNFAFAAELEDSNYVAYWGTADVKQVAESISDGPPCSETDYEENHDLIGDNISAEAEATENCPDAQKDSQFYFVQEKLESETLVCGVNPERENLEGTTAADISSEATNMDWENEHLFCEANCFIKVHTEPHLESEVNGKAKLQKTSDTYSYEEIPCDEIVGYIFSSSEAQFLNHYQGQDVNNQDAVVGTFKDDQDSPNEETYGEFLVTGGKKRLAERDGLSLAEDPTIDGIEEDQDDKSRMPEAENFKIGSQQGDDQIALNSESMVEAMNIVEENYDIKDTKTDIFFSNQTPDALIMSTTEKLGIDADGRGGKSKQDNTTYSSLEHELINADCGLKVEENKQVANAYQNNEVNKTIVPYQINKTTENSDLTRATAHQHNERTKPVICTENILGKCNKSTSSKFITSEERSYPELNISSSLEGRGNETEKMEVEDGTKTDTSEMTLAAESTNRKRSGDTILRSRTISTEELLSSCNSLKWIINRRRASDSWVEYRKFNPQEPNYLPLVPDLEAQKVDLRHQDMDERKNSEDWMLDHALQKAVNKLAPARKRKVALLVEAFETVLPVNMCDTRVKNSTEFLHTRPVQACN